MIVTLLAVSFLPTAINGLCQLSDCSTPTSLHPSCPSEDFTKLEIYEPLEQTKPAVQDPHHLFNLIYDQSASNCTEVGLGPSEHDSRGFNYYLTVACRSSNYFGVHLGLEATLDQEAVTCFRPMNETTWMAKRCRIFVQERIRFNFELDRGLLMLEDLSERAVKNPYHLFNLINDPSERDCTELVLRPESPKNGEFRYYLTVLCRNRAVYVTMEAHYRSHVSSVPTSPCGL
ncbi:hypothetical protein pipiens_001547 [Culex pipiens pipiens]|uniref:Uncharacterized protein n=1 Tax=Culex pipiens pipiens TaxID=38569 RepID=A0ABD1CLR9_CULPP